MLADKDFRISLLKGFNHFKSSESVAAWNYLTDDILIDLQSHVSKYEDVTIRGIINTLIHEDLHKAIGGIENNHHFAIEKIMEAK